MSQTPPVEVHFAPSILDSLSPRHSHDSVVHSLTVPSLTEQLLMLLCRMVVRTMFTFSISQLPIENRGRSPPTEKNAAAKFRRKLLRSESFLSASTSVNH